MNQAKIYIFDTKKYSFEDLVKRFPVTNEELEIFDSILNIRYKKEKYISLVMKKRLIGNYSIEKNKKPVSNNNFFNVSHSNGVVILGISESKEIGVDLEEIKPFNVDVKNKIANKKEKKYIENDLNFYEIWTAKEAILKMDGCGLIYKLHLVPSLPLNSLKLFKNTPVFVKTSRIVNQVLSIAIKGTEEFDFSIIDFDNKE